MWDWVDDLLGEGGTQPLKRARRWWQAAAATAGGWLHERGAEELLECHDATGTAIDAVRVPTVVMMLMVVQSMVARNDGYRGCSMRGQSQPKTKRKRQKQKDKKTNDVIRNRVPTGT